MPTTEEAQARLAGIPNLTVSSRTPLSRYTRFGIGGPADLYAETESVEAFIAATQAARESGVSVETVKLGIPARRRCASSACGITSIIREAFL